MTRSNRVSRLALVVLSRASPAPTRAQYPAPVAATRYPLDPLDPEEIEASLAAISEDGRCAGAVRFVAIIPDEPPLENARHRKPGDFPVWQSFIVLRDGVTGQGYEAVDDLPAGSVRRYESFPEGVQPSIMGDEFGEVTEAVRKAPAFHEAMKKWGIEDLSRLMVDAWSAGHHDKEPPEDNGKRLVRTLCWVRAELADNGNAHPIMNILAVVDLNRKELVRPEDDSVVPIPSRPGH
jgi:primary-amine oxidase